MGAHLGFTQVLGSFRASRQALCGSGGTTSSKCSQARSTAAAMASCSSSACLTKKPWSWKKRTSAALSTTPGSARSGAENTRLSRCSATVWLMRDDSAGLEGSPYARCARPPLARWTGSCHLALRAATTNAPKVAEPRDL